MIKPNHIALAQMVTTSGIVLCSPHPSVAIPILVGSYFGSDLPDIDHPKNRLNVQLDKMKLGFITKFLRHRGITHTIWPVLLLLLCSTIFHTTKTPLNTVMLANFFFGLAIGYLIHLLADDQSYQGVLWFYPFQHWNTNSNGHHYKKRKTYRHFYTVGGTGEAYFGLFCRIIWYSLSIYLYIKWFLHIC